MCVYTVKFVLLVALVFRFGGRESAAALKMKKYFMLQNE